jgi:hypothetical protein
VITDANLDVLRRFEAHGIRLAAPMQVHVHSDGRGPVMPIMDEMTARKITTAAASDAELPAGTMPQ